MTNTRLCRRMILQCSQIRLTLARIFIEPLSLSTGSAPRRPACRAEGEPNSPILLCRHRLDKPRPIGLAVKAASRGRLVALRQGQDARAVDGYRHRVLEVGGEGTILRLDRPAVVEGADLLGPQGDHRLDREHDSR